MLVLHFKEHIQFTFGFKSISASLICDIFKKDLEKYGIIYNLNKHETTFNEALQRVF